MYSNGPVSMRCECVRFSARYRVRSLTQLHVTPLSSGYMVRRKVIVSPSSLTTSVAAYSVNRSGQFGTSLVMSQTSWNGASMRIWLSVCPAMSQFPLRGLLFGVLVDVVDDRLDVQLAGLVGDLHAVLLGDHDLQLQHGERVEAQLLERAIAVGGEGLRRQADLLHEQCLDVFERHVSHGGTPYLS